MGATASRTAVKSKPDTTTGRRPAGRRRAVAKLLADFGKDGQGERADDVAERDAPVRLEGARRGVDFVAGLAA